MKRVVQLNENILKFRKPMDQKILYYFLFSITVKSESNIKRDVMSYDCARENKQTEADILSLSSYSIAGYP
jgi:hypothetical protein